MNALQKKSTCPVNCDKHGKCDSVSGLCNCDDGWYGKGCSKQYCPGNCYGNGVCSKGKCICDAGYTGINCDFQGPKHCLHCINGACDVDGKCQCFSGWKGNVCDEKIVHKNCPKDCNDAGTCNEETGECICQPGWGGDACDKQLKPVSTGTNATNRKNSNILFYVLFIVAVVGILSAVGWGIHQDTLAPSYWGYLLLGTILAFSLLIVLRVVTK